MAKKKITGITIEINGDTTKLDKALSATDKAAKTTQANLKDVQRLLKLDPTNVELLAQKQDFLSQRVEQTSDRYEALKAALEQSTASNVKYAQWEKAQASLQGQITQTENTLRSLEAEQQKLIDLGFPVDSTDMVALQEQIDATRQRSEALHQELDSTYEALGRPIPVEQYQTLQRELVGAEADMKAAKKAADDFHPALARVEAQAQKVSDATGKAAEATKGLSTVAGGAVIALGGLAVSAGKTADDINTMSKQTGFSTEAVQSWMYASDLIDVSVDDIVSATTKLKQNVDSDSADIQDAFRTLGVTVRNSTTGDILPMELIFDQVLRSLEKIPDPVQRDVLAMQLLGENADKLAGLIDDGGEALRQYAQEAKDAGLILSQDALDGANEFNDQLDEISARARASMLQFGASMAEALTPELENLVGLLSSALKWFTSLDQGLLKFIFTFGLVISTIAPIFGLISNIGGAISTMGKAASVFSKGAGNSFYLTFVKWAAVIAGIIALLVVLLALIAALSGKGDEVSKVSRNLKGIGSGTGSGGGMYTPPGYADGGVFAPNSPVLGILGDNKHEREVAAPESMLRGLLNDAVAASGGSRGPTQVNIRFTGSLAQLGRVLQPVVSTEESRQGPSITPRR